MSLDLGAVRERRAAALELHGRAEVAYVDASVPVVLVDVLDLMTEVERLRLALVSAQGRAAGYRDELDETKALLVEVSQAYLEACQSLQVLRGDLP